MTAFSDALTDLTAKGIEATLDGHVPAQHPADTTAIAVVVAPENADEVIQALPADQLLRFVWFCEEIVRRANAAKKGAIIEAVMASQRGEISPLLEVDGHHYQLREGSRTKWSDVGGLFYLLERMGVSVTDLGNSVSEARVTDLRAAVERAKWTDEQRKDALQTIEAHRIDEPTSAALIDLDSVYRNKRRPAAEIPTAGAKKE